MKRLIAIILLRAKPAAAAPPNQSHSVANLIISGVQQKQLNLSPADPSHNSNITTRVQSCKKENGWMDGGTTYVLFIHRKKNSPGEIDHRAAPRRAFLSFSCEAAYIVLYNCINTESTSAACGVRRISLICCRLPARESCSSALIPKPKINLVLQREISLTRSAAGLARQVFSFVGDEWAECGWIINKLRNVRALDMRIAMRYGSLH